MRSIPGPLGLPKRGASNAEVGTVEALAGNFTSGINLSCNTTRQASNGSKVFDVATPPANRVKKPIVGGCPPRFHQPH